MPRRPALVTQADIARATRALLAAGYADVRVVLRPGEVIVEPATGAGSRSSNDGSIPGDEEELAVL